jgi:hypothetical protein
LIWSYFWLLIVEGALRKWIMPGLANPLLVVRDPVVILIYAIALQKGVFPWNKLVIATIALALASALASVLAAGFGGRGNSLVTLYGLRTNFLHLPLVFLLPRVFLPVDVEKIGKALLILAFPMMLLVAGQFRAPADSRLNVGAGGGMGGQIEVGFGKIRPPGPFSYNTGLLAYLTVTAAYLLNTQMRKAAPGAKLALAALPAVAIMVALSGSRSTLASMAIILAGVILICLRQPAFFVKAAKGFLAIGVAYFCLIFWTEFRNGLFVHETRIVTGGGLEDGLLLRFIGDLAAPFQVAADTPPLGAGLGLGTNAAAGLLTGERTFLLAEGEWERVVRESGPILGFAFIGLRLAILIQLGRVALQALNRKNPLPALLFFAVLPQMLNGQFGVPTTLGFAVFIAGLTLAAAQESMESAASLAPAPAIGPAAPIVKTIRGRSEYAERLHRE